MLTNYIKQKKLKVLLISNYKNLILIQGTEVNLKYTGFSRKKSTVPIYFHMLQATITSYFKNENWFPDFFRLKKS